MERAIANGTVSLAVDDMGEGLPVIGLHGLTATRRYVLMGSRALERDGHRVVLYDARGHGVSSPGPAYGYAELVGDLRAVMNGLRIDRAVLVGVSMGAHTLLRFALDDPGRVAALALVTPAYDPGELRGDLASWDALAAGLRAGGVEGFVAAYDLTALDPRWRALTETVLRQRLVAHENLAAVADALEQVPRSRPFASFADLRQVVAPTLVVGTRDQADPGHPLAVAGAYAAAIPNARLVVEDEGASPLAWQGGRLSRLVAELAAVAE